MSLWKQTSKGARCLLGPARNIVVRQSFSKKHNPTPTCMTKSKKSQEQSGKCEDTHPKPRDAKTIRQTFPFYNLIEFSQECCPDPCADSFPPFDECLYKESDKNKRKYQVTWSECPPVAIMPKKICCFEKIQRAPVNRRDKSERPATACEPPPCKKATPAELGCPRIKLPRCGPARIPPRCHRVRFPSDCVKVKAPYPAFSECARPKLRKKRRSECTCLAEIPQCELNRILNRRLETGNISMNPCERKP
ncbi:uncharacterized protein LOC6580357 [Drosophila mojavensis]|uniref:Uncharacterized protein n=1 Tax=Drosophila mojavensis TaxID=7230 RepID=B4KPE3_DROMO|nr:uncharacterized protein LOC6580357 [Drosophila mojavensis]EDW10139.1 uncharacterized protein Dmoj_GI20909 [Drosophila mojavensis]